MKKIIIVSSYPSKLKIHDEKTVGVASYTKNLLLSLKKNKKDLGVEVLAEYFDKKESYVENGIKVERLWKRNSIISLFSLLKLLVCKKEKQIIFSFEAYMFGDIFINIFFFLMLVALKIFGKKIIIIFHQVVKELKFFYLPFLLLVDKVIIFENYFKNVLWNSKKVIFIPHAVEDFNIKKQILNNENILYFGYLSPYKGIDFLIEIWEKNYGNLIIAGGGNPNHMGNKKYHNFVKNILNKAKEKKIITTGFLPEEEIVKYFKKTSLVIFPYKMFFSSSGPLSLAFSFEKPFIFSRPLEGYFESPDFKEALKETGLKKEDFIFDFNKKSFEKRLQWARNNLEKLSQFSKAMKEKRSWDKIAKIYLQVLEEKR